MNLEVLRVGHRRQRDKRITTHVGLTARALGARRMHLAESDADVARSIESLVTRFGGRFEVRHGTGWRRVVRAWQENGGQVAHLTMYGQPLTESAQAMRERGADVLAVVGAEKVPRELYDLADCNVAVGNQPHSEITALALLLDRLRGGAWEQDRFEGGELAIEPSRRGKRVRRQEG